MSANIITIDSTLSGLSSDVASYLEQNISPEDRRAVAELIQATEKALGRASEALARIFLSLEGSRAPQLADEFVAYLRGKGLSKQRLSRIRIAARVRAELSRSSRLDLEPIRSQLLALGDDLLDVYQRLPDTAKEKAHAIIRAKGGISRKQLRELQTSAKPDPAPVTPFRVEPEPVSAPISEAVSALSGSHGSMTVAELQPEPEPVSALASVAPLALPPIRSIDDIRDRIRKCGLNGYQILAAAIDVLRKRDVNILYPHTRDQLESLTNVIDSIDREYRNHMR